MAVVVTAPLRGLPRVAFASIDRGLKSFDHAWIDDGCTRNGSTDHREPVRHRNRILLRVSLELGSGVVRTVELDEQPDIEKSQIEDVVAYLVLKVEGAMTNGIVLDGFVRPLHFSELA